jgi:hypothetical protein
LAEVLSNGSGAEPRDLVETAAVEEEAITSGLIRAGSGVERFLEEVAVLVDGFAGAGGGTGVSVEGLDGVTGSPLSRDCLCCSGVSAEWEWETEVIAKSRRADTSVSSGSSVSRLGNWTGLWLRYSQRSALGLYLTNLSWYEPESL